MTDLKELKRLVEAGPQLPLRFRKGHDDITPGVIEDATGEGLMCVGAGDGAAQQAVLIVAAINAAPVLLAAVEAAQTLVERLDVVHDSSEFVGVFSLWQNHFGPYEGPTYKDELTATREALQALSPAEEVRP